MTLDQLTQLLTSEKHQSKTVDAELFAAVLQKLITYNYDEDKEGTQEIKLYARNGHIVYKGTELILSNQS